MYAYSPPWPEHSLVIAVSLWLPWDACAESGKYLPARTRRLHHLLLPSLLLLPTASAPHTLLGHKDTRQRSSLPESAHFLVSLGGGMASFEDTAGSGVS